MGQQDLGYKRVFAHREMVADLLLGFVREPWVAEVEMDTLERVSGTYVSDDLREREDDIIWRVRWRGRWLYVYLLLEFQATVDSFMALRILVYAGLFATRPDSGEQADSRRAVAAGAAGGVVQRRRWLDSGS